MEEKIISLEMLTTFGRMINEELGHSEEVDEETFRVSQDLEMMVKSNKPNVIPKDKFIIKNFNIIKKVFNKIIKFAIKGVYFIDDKTYKMLENNVKFDYSYNSGNGTAEITIVMAGNQIVADTFTPFVAHEIRHHHQVVKSNCLVLNTKQYEKFKSADDAKNPFYKILRNIAYCSQEKEQQAYGQELYHELCLRKPTQYYYALEDCNAYKTYKRMEKNISTIEKYKDSPVLYKALHSFGYEVDSFIEKVKESCKNFLRRLGRIVALYEKNKDGILRLGENISYEEYIH